MKKFISTFCAVAIVVLLSACSTKTVYENKYDYDDGWRQGVVTEIGAGQRFINQIPDECKPKASSLSASKYAMVRYRLRNSPKWHALPVSADTPLKVDDFVYININDCKSPVIPKAIK